MQASRAHHRLQVLLSHCSHESPNSNLLMTRHCSASSSATTTPPATTTSSGEDVIIESDLYDQSNEELNEKHALKEINIDVINNEKTGKYEMKAIAEELSFDQGFFYAIRAIQELKKCIGADSVICVGVSGPAGAGKTFLAKRIAEVVKGVVIQMDKFVKIENVIDQNFEDVSLVDFHAVNKVLQQLKSGQPAEVPKVSFQKRRIVGKTVVQVPPGKVVILDGLYALNKMLRPSLDVTIALSGGVHLDLLNRIMREVTPKKNTIEKITQIVFPMYKAFIEPDTREAKIRIAGSYNPMTTIADPLYVCRAKYSDVREEIDAFIKEQTSLMSQQESKEVLELGKKKFKDLYLYPPKYDPNSGSRSDRQKWIRIRNDNGKFYLYFYNEMMNSVVNVRPQLYFEISVRTLGGLLSLGYQIGAVIDRETTTIYDRDGIQITVDRIMSTDYVQIKGKDRNKVIKVAERLKMTAHHIPQSFLYLHFRNLALKQKSSQQQQSVDQE